MTQPKPKTDPVVQLRKPAMTKPKPDIYGERLVRIETALDSHFEADRASFAAINAQLAALQTSVAVITSKLDRQAGIYLGVTAAVTTLWAVVSVVAKYLA